MAGLLGKLVDATLLVFFAMIAVGAPLMDAQICLPQRMFPDVLVQLNDWFIRVFEDYLIDEKPRFFVGLIWLELFFQWPLALANIYGILTAKPWIRTTCLIFGVCTFTAMVAVLSELIGSGKASDKMLKTYYPFLGFAVLAILRGLVPQCGKSGSTTAGKVSALARRKKRS